MQSLLTYILQASIAGSFCYLMYYFFLRRTTFFKWNRTFFLIAIALSIALPALNFVPASLPVKPVNTVQQYIPDFSFQSQAGNNTDWKFVVINLFYAGILLMSARFLGQLFSVIRLGKKSEKHKLNDIVIVNITKNISPFSFFNHIYINSKQHNAADFEQILRHEIVHAKEGHSIDILIAEIYNIVFWFNPFAWLLKTSLKQNLEFITDTKVLKSGVDAKLYQYCLLKVSGIHTNMAAANHFNFTKLKNRIIMMNKKRSSQINILKYLLLLPLVTFLLMSFNNNAKKHSGSPLSLFSNNNILATFTTDTVPEEPEIAPVPPAQPGDVVIPSPEAFKSLKIQKLKGVKIVTDMLGGKTTVTTKSGTEVYDLSNATDKKKFEQKYGALPEPPPPPPVPAIVPPPPPVPRNVPPPPPTAPAKVPIAINVHSSVNTKPLVIVDGHEVASIKQVDEKTVTAVNVLKDEDAVKAYGEKGRNGVVVVSTKVTPDHDGVRSVKTVNVIAANENVKPTGPHKLLNSSGTENALFFVDGKETSREEAIKIRSESIYRINVIKDAPSLKKYGEKGKHGVIEITTK